MKMSELFDVVDYRNRQIKYINDIYKKPDHGVRVNKKSLSFFNELKKDYHNYVPLTMSLDTYSKLAEIVSDLEFLNEVILPSFQFAIPMFDKMFIVADVIDVNENRVKVSTFINRKNNVLNIDCIGLLDKTQSLSYMSYGASLDFNKDYDDDGVFVIHKDKLEKGVDPKIANLYMLTDCLILAFLLINKKANVLTTIGQKSVISPKGIVKYGAHKTIDLKLFDKKEIRSIVTPPGHRSSPRRHPVRGHWVHFGEPHNCEHDWERVICDDPSEDDGRIRYRCSKCGVRRTWRNAFNRGDALKGFVNHDYVA